MDFLTETNWFAIQTKPHCERLAAAGVARLDLEVFLPRVNQEQIICGTRHRVVKPLFRGYFFARFCPMISLGTTRGAHGVLRVVGTSRFPIPLDGAVVEGLQARVQTDGFVPLQARAFRPGDEVTIEHGPFAGLLGNVERELDDGRRVALLLAEIQCARVLVEKRWLAQVASGA